MTDLLGGKVLFNFINCQTCEKGPKILAQAYKWNKSGIKSAIYTSRQVLASKPIFGTLISGLIEEIIINNITHIKHVLFNIN